MNHLKIVEITKVITDFVAYVDSFYNPTHGLYAIETATPEKIGLAVTKYVASLNEENLNELIHHGADTFDREKVRDLLLTT